MFWFVYALLAVGFSTMFALLSRIISINSQYPRAYSVIFEVSAALFSLLLITTEPFSLHTLSWSILFLTFLTTLCYGVSDRLLFFVNRSLDASSLTIIDKLASIVTFVTSVYLLGESITLRKLIAVSLIIGGNLLVVYKSSVIKLNRGFVLALIAATCFGLASTIDKRASTAYSLSTYSFITFFVPAIYNMFFPPLSLSIVVYEFKRASWKILLLAALSTLAYYCTLKALRGAEASLVIPIVNSSTIFVVLAGMIFLKERSHIDKKIIAGLCVVIGIFLLSS